MILDPVTTRYADALYEIAKEADAVEAIQADTARLSAEVAPPEVATFLFGSGVAQAERESKMEPLLAELHGTTQTFVKLLFQKRRQEVLRHIGEAFKRKVYDETGKVEGTVEVPRELPDEDVNALEASIGKRLGKTVLLSQVIKPELVAGARVVVGAHLFDATVKGRLDALRESLLTAPLPN